MVEVEKEMYQDKEELGNLGDKKMAQTYLNKNRRRCFSDSGKQVSRWVAEKKIGRPLQRSEVVHHGSRGKGCNNSGNITVFKSQSEHMKKAHSKRRGWF
jgi:hypothetical protein